MGNTMTGTAHAETLDRTVSALWDATRMPGGVSRAWEVELAWHAGRLAGALVLADGSRAYGTTGMPLDAALVGAWITDARQAIERVKRNPHGDPVFDW